MGQENDVKKRGGGKHFTWEDRVRLETLVRTLYPGGRKPNFADLAGRLGRHRSSVSREYRRGKTVNWDSQLKGFPVYSARKAQDDAGRAALNKGPRGKLTMGVAAAIAALILQEKFSPYAAVMRLRACGGLPWVPCERSVYYAVDAGLIGVSRSQLPYRPTGSGVKGPAHAWPTPTPAAGLSRSARRAPGTGASTGTGRWTPSSAGRGLPRRASWS